MARVRSLQSVCLDCIHTLEGKVGGVRADLHLTTAHKVAEGHRPVLNSRAFIHLFIARHVGS